MHSARSKLCRSLAIYKRVVLYLRVRVDIKSRVTFLALNKQARIHSSQSSVRQINTRTFVDGLNLIRPAHYIVFYPFFVFALYIVLRTGDT